jgi:hypothetical protein
MVGESQSLICGLITDEASPQADQEGPCVTKIADPAVANPKTVELFDLAEVDSDETDDWSAACYLGPGSARRILSSKLLWSRVYYSLCRL